MNDPAFIDFMKGIAAQIGGELTDVWGMDVGINVRLDDARFVTFSPGEMGPNDPNDFWVAGYYDDTIVHGSDHQDAQSHTTRIPNTSRDADRIVTWAKGIVAALS